MVRPYRTADDERDVFRALAHPLRRKMVTASLDQPRTFTQLQQLTRRSAATVSAHLRILRNAHVITPKRSGHSMSYQVNRQALRSSAQWLADAAAAPAAH